MVHFCSLWKQQHNVNKKRNIFQNYNKKATTTAKKKTETLPSNNRLWRKMAKTAGGLKMKERSWHFKQEKLT